MLGPIEQPSAGLSSITLFLDVTWDGGRESLVARLPPEGPGLFPAYDLAGQARIQRAVATAGIPAAVPLAFVEDPSWVGAPFLVMPRIAGRTLPTHPSPLRKGWLVDLTPEDQARLHASFVRTLATIHRLDWQRMDVEFLAGAATPSELVEQWATYLDWASDGVSPPDPLVNGLAWCEQHLPPAWASPSLLWGDVQLVNAVFDDDLQPAAILDWEMASIGPPELDLGWFLALHRMTAEVAGRDLPGFPDHDTTVARYETELGRRAMDLPWYEAFALVRSGAILFRVARVLAARGVDDSWLMASNPTFAALDRLLA